MNAHQRLADELREAVPARLRPPADLADTVLRRAGRDRLVRRVRAGVAVAAAVGVAGLSIPVLTGRVADPGQVVVAGAPGGPAVSAGIAHPAPGGGPRVILAYTTSDDGAPGYLLDPATGRYRRLPYEILLSPRGDRVAVTRDGRTGIAEAGALLRSGDRAVRWTDLPAGAGLAWSPDGTALLLTALDKGGPDAGGPAGPSFTAHRYDVATGGHSVTPLAGVPIGQAGWAADSRRYLVMFREPGTDTATGDLRYINPDGSFGPLLDIDAGLIGGADSFSPSRRYAVADASRLEAGGPTVVVDLRTGAVAASLGERVRVVGWYDNRSVIRLTGADAGDAALERVDFRTGEVLARVALTGYPWSVQTGSSAGLSGKAAELGF